MLLEINWSSIIIDEAHRIKEPKALVTIAAKKLRAKSRVGLTGTPLQNCLNELWYELKLIYIEMMSF